MKWVVCVLTLAAAAGTAAAQPSVGTQTINQTPQTLTGGMLRDGTPHVCVIEMRPTTKVVYTSVQKDYCRYDGSVLGILRRCFGGGGCPCELATRTILVKKVVPGPDVPVCVVKAMPVACAAGDLPVPGPQPGFGQPPGAAGPGYVGLAPQFRR